MASFKVLFFLSLHVLFLISSSGTRLFHPFPIADNVLMIEEAKAYKKAGKDEPEAKERPKAIIERQYQVSETNHKSKQFPSSSKRALVEEAGEATKGIQRKGEYPLQSPPSPMPSVPPHH
ncbi:hypothetical protein PTKIN_Ptkin14bG0158400 [Pterospermum kingtungense]